MAQATEVLAFYRRQTAMSDPGRHAGTLAALPDGPAGIARTAQGLILHEHWSGAYGETLSDARRAEVHLRPIAAIIDQALADDPAPLTQARAPRTRVIGNCRDFTLFTVAALRARGIPARARCGFAGYFETGQWVDHWVAEAWNVDEGRWVRIDAQIDGLQAERIKADFDLVDLPPGRFLDGGAAWRACRAGAADPESFGIMHMRGLWFVAGDLARDAAALSGHEMLPWDCWGAMPQPGETMGDAALAWFDHLAELTTNPDGNFDALLALDRDDARQRVPEVVFNAVRGRDEAVLG